MKILFAVYDFSEEDAKYVIESMASNGLCIDSYDMKFSKISVMQYLDDNPDTDVVILSANLESVSPFNKKDFEHLIESHEDTRLIPIVNNDCEGSGFIKDLFNLGIFDATYSKDADVNVIIRLVEKGRSRKEARLYYKIANDVKTENKANIQQCVRYICDSSPEELVSNTLYIKNKVSDSEFLQIKDALPREILDALANSDECQDIVSRVQSSKTKKDRGSSGGLQLKSILKFPMRFSSDKNEGGIKVSDKTLQKSENSDSPTEEDAEEKAFDSSLLSAVLSNVLIGVTGTQKRVGVSHQAIIIAHYLSNLGYRVALADCSYSNGKCFSAIQKYCLVEQEKNFFSFEGVDYYDNTKLEDLNAILSIKEKYHFVVIDYGVFSQRVKTDIGRCSIKLCMCGLNPWEIGSTIATRNEMKASHSDMVYVANSKINERVSLGDDIFQDCIVMENQEDPFSGNCYASLANLFDLYAGKKENVSVPVRKEPVGSRIFQKKPHAEKKSNVSSYKEFIGTATYFITGLKHGCGCSHFAATVANCLVKDKRVCVVSTFPSMCDYVDSSVFVAKTGQSYSKLYESYDVIVFDCGIYNELNALDLEECMRADRKIMMCWANDDYMSNLASFVDSQGDSGDSWSFVFSNVPDSQIRSVNAVMKEYLTCYLPMYATDNIPREVKKIVSVTLK